MALARTTLTVAHEKMATDDAITTASFTPSNGSLLVAILVALNPDGTAGAATITDTAGLTWTNRVSRDQNNFYASHIEIWTAPVVTGVSMTVTGNSNSVNLNTSSEIFLGIFQITGHDTTTPIRQTFSDGANVGRAGAYSNNFAGALLATSLVITGATSDNDDWLDTLTTPGSGWTEVYEAPSPGGFNGFYSEERTGTTSAAVEFVKFDAGYSWVLGAVEIAAAAGGGAVQLNRAILVG